MCMEVEGGERGRSLVGKGCAGYLRGQVVRGARDEVAGLVLGVRGRGNDANGGDRCRVKGMLGDKVLRVVESADVTVIRSSQKVPGDRSEAAWGREMPDAPRNRTGHG